MATPACHLAPCHLAPCRWQRQVGGFWPWRIPKPCRLACPPWEMRLPYGMVLASTLAGTAAPAVRVVPADSIPWALPQSAGLGPVCAQPLILPYPVPLGYPMQWGDRQPALQPLQKPSQTCRVPWSSTEVLPPRRAKRLPRAEGMPNVCFAVQTCRLRGARLLYRCAPCAQPGVAPRPAFEAPGPCAASAPLPPWPDRGAPRRRVRTSAQSPKQTGRWRWCGPNQPSPRAAAIPSPDRQCLQPP
mmetsp:Transcript_47834/g.137193  ORF Transcript_47834/g.137193 Transcript_47834/m.137193 type:complete len:244 (+) Transcript_47834:922-1653(+)